MTAISGTLEDWTGNQGQTANGSQTRAGRKSRQLSRRLPGFFPTHVLYKTLKVCAHSGRKPLEMSTYRQG